MKKAAAAALTTSAAVANGVDLAGQVSAVAAEMIRTRRDPSVQAEKKVRAARRRVSTWSAGAVVGGALTATGAVMIADDGLTAGVVGITVLFVALLVWCIVGLVRATVDLRVRKRVAAELPAPAPARPAVAGAIRPEMAQLDGYSDGLRQLVGMIGIVEDDPSLRQLRDEILAAADVSEARLRRQAKDLTGLIKARRAAPPAAAAQLDTTVKGLRQQIRAGVAGYGELVSAASEAVVASRNLADRTAHPSVGGPSLSKTDQPIVGTLHPELDQPIDQLRSLAAGMRELTQE
jgi:hypothetical protein